MHGKGEYSERSSSFRRYIIGQGTSLSFFLPEHGEPQAVLQDYGVILAAGGEETGCKPHFHGIVLQHLMQRFQTLGFHTW